jgi:hypothetical protein
VGVNLRPITEEATTSERCEHARGRWPHFALASRVCRRDLTVLGFVGLFAIILSYAVTSILVGHCG